MRAVKVWAMLAYPFIWIYAKWAGWSWEQQPVTPETVFQPVIKGMLEPDIVTAVELEVEGGEYREGDFFLAPETSAVQFMPPVDWKQPPESIDGFLRPNI